LRKLLFWVTTVAIALTFFLIHSTPALPQSAFDPGQDLTINAATRLEVIQAVMKTLDDYVFPEVAQKVQADIRTRAAYREYDTITSATKLAQTLTSQIQAISNDKHLNVFYSHEL
jgi:retinol-binding protein 3